jgi:hypothetical protein
MAEVQVNKADGVLKEKRDPLPPRSLAGGASGVTECGPCFHKDYSLVQGYLGATEASGLLIRVERSVLRSPECFTIRRL